MSGPAFRVETLSNSHDRTGFKCGEEALEHYFRYHVTQDVRRHIANCFVAVESSTGTVAGYYTLSATGIPFTSLPAEVTKKLPRYPVLPAVRIGRLAVRMSSQGKRLGSALLADAAARALRAEVAAFVLLVDAKNDKAVQFYHKFGFKFLESAPRTLFLPIETARKALR